MSAIRNNDTAGADDVAARVAQPTQESAPSGGLKKFPVMEIFGPTIQGEGQVVGYQTLFVRFGGCDYKCTKCDSLHAVIPELVRANATYMSTHQLEIELENRRAATGVEWVTFSGGNPAIHDLGYLVTRLKELGWKIQVETQATHYRNWISRCDAVVLSPKAPGMGEKFIPEVFTQFITNLGPHGNTVIKIVVFSAADVEFALSVFELAYAQSNWYFSTNRPWKYLSLGNPTPPIAEGNQAANIQGMLPAFSQDYLLEHYRVLLEDILNDRRTKDCVVLPQVHVLIWGNKQGV